MLCSALCAQFLSIIRCLFCVSPLLYSIFLQQCTHHCETQRKKHPCRRSKIYNKNDDYYHEMFSSNIHTHTARERKIVWRFSASFASYYSTMNGDDDKDDDSLNSFRAFEFRASLHVHLESNWYNYCFQLFFSSFFSLASLSVSFRCRRSRECFIWIGFGGWE